MELLSNYKYNNMRFSEFEQLLFNEYFDRDYNSESDPFDTLTFSFGNRLDYLNQYVFGPFMKNSYWEDLMENVIKYQEYYFLTTFYESNYEQDPIPLELEQLINRDLGRTIVKVPKPTVAGMSFYTIVPKARLPFNEVEVMRMFKFCESFFENSKLFKMVHFCVEAGKHKEKPNLHIHALILFKSGAGKNFSRLLKTAWNKVYKESKYNIIYKEKGNCGIHRVPCNTLKIQEDKVSYMSNDSKGSHINFIDLKKNQKFVF